MILFQISYLCFAEQSTIWGCEVFDETPSQCIFYIWYAFPTDTVQPLSYSILPKEYSKFSITVTILESIIFAVCFDITQSHTSSQWEISYHNYNALFYDIG